MKKTSVISSKTLRTKKTVKKASSSAVLSSKKSKIFLSFPFYRNLISKAFSVFVIIGLLITPMPIVFAVQPPPPPPPYSITGAYTLSGLTVTLSGTASANPYTGPSSQQNIGVDWTGACSAASFTNPPNNNAYTFPFDSITFVGGTGGDQNGGTFTNATWSTSHTFPSAGTYSVCVKVYHANFNGAEGSFAATFSPTTLTIIKHVINDNGSTAEANDFTMNVTGTSVSASSFTGSEAGTTITLSAGSYSVDESEMTGYTKTLSTDCVGTIAAGENKTCTITNNDNSTDTLPILSDVPSSVTIPEMSLYTFTATATDSDLPANILTFSLVAGVDPVPSGALINFSTGVFTWTPTEAQGPGVYPFNVRVSDGTNNVDTSITITVDEVNVAPAALNDSYSTNEDTLVTTGNVLTNDTDSDFPLNTLIVSAADSASVNGGTVVNNNNGTFNYTPALNFNGPDTFTYTVSDGSLSDVGTVTINVDNSNDTPVALADSYSTNEDTTLTVVIADGVLDNDTDVDGNPLTAVLVDDVTNGSLTLNADGSFDYIPDTNFNGSDSFVYHANDGTTANSSDVTVTIIVNPVNDVPVANDDSYSTNEDIAINDNVLINDTDLENDPLTAILDTDVSNGTLTLNANGSFTYTPDLDYVGPDSFTYSADDGTDSGNIATVTLDVIFVPPNQHLLSVDVTGIGSGSVTSNPAGISCDSDCTENYNENTPVELTAVSNGNSYFDGWTGCDSELGTTCTVNMDAAENVTASFGILIISSEQAINISETSITITWTTNHPATSRVIWGRESIEGNIDGYQSENISGDTFGYSSTNEEDGNLTTEHSVIINDLVPGTTYYFRTVSHGSPTAVSSQVSATTSSSSGSGGGGGGGSGGGGGGSAGTFISGPLANSPQVAGASIVETPTPQVAGAMTVLPATGASTFDRILLSIFAALFATGALMLLAGYEILPRKILRKIR